MEELKLFYQQNGENNYEIILQAERSMFERFGYFEWKSRNHLKSLADNIIPKKHENCFKHVYELGIHQRKDRVIEVVDGKHLHSYFYVCGEQNLEQIKQYCTQNKIEVQEGIESKVREAFLS